MSRKAFWEVVTTLLLGLSLSAALQASIDRGVIQGTVTDPAGALVPGAKVVVKNVDTNVEVTLVTNAVGFYLAPELVPGRYIIRTESRGFDRVPGESDRRGADQESEIQRSLGAPNRAATVRERRTRFELSQTLPHGRGSV